MEMELLMASNGRSFPFEFLNRSGIERKPPVAVSGNADGSDDEATSRGGYDLEFSPTLEPKYFCPICMMVLREPVQTNCGHRFCKSCLFHWLRQSSSCPTCKSPVKRGDTFLDKYAKREILGFTVLCPNAKDGCASVIELKDVEKHLCDVCMYVHCACPNGCSQNIMRLNLGSHLHVSCPANRSYTCEHCASTVLLSERQRHSSVCRKIQEICEVCSEVVPKSQMAFHKKDLCSLHIVQCTFRPFGCLEQCQRQHMSEHIVRNMSKHLEMLARYVLKSDQSIDSKVTAIFKMLVANHGKELDSSSHLKTLYAHHQLRPNHVHPAHDLLEDGPASEKRLKEFSTTANVTSSKSLDEMNFDTRKALVLLERRLNDQDRQLVEYKEHIKRLEHTIYDLSTKTSYGTFIWRIPDFTRQLQEAKLKKNSILYSPGFYSSCYGYKTCLRIHLNGTGVGWDRCASLFIHFMPGDYDSILRWPFEGRITLAILDQKEDFKLRSDILESISSSPLVEAFERPRESRNHKGFGYIEFVPLSTLLNSGYVKDDVLYIRASVEAAV